MGVELWFDPKFWFFALLVVGIFAAITNADRVREFVYQYGVFGVYWRLGLALILFLALVSLCRAIGGF